MEKAVTQDTKILNSDTISKADCSAGFGKVLNLFTSISKILVTIIVGMVIIF